MHTGLTRRSSGVVWPTQRPMHHLRLHMQVALFSSAVPDRLPQGCRVKSWAGQDVTTSGELKLAQSTLLTFTNGDAS